MTNIHDKQDPGKLVDREFAEAWRPSPGDKLVGEIVELGQRAGYDDELYPIVTVHQDDGVEFALHAFHTVLRNEFTKLAPQVGQRIAVKYEGEVASANGRSRYHSYRVATDHVPAFSWGAFGEDAAVEPDVPTDDRPAVDREFDDRAKADDNDVPF
jgi:hypothetical protein